jgi:CHAT domain-containing protein
MFMRLVLLCTFVLLSFASFSQKVTPEDYTASMKTGEDAYHDSNFEESRKQYELASQQARTLYSENSWEFSNAIWSLVYVYESLDLPEKVEDKFNHVVQVCSKLPQQNDDNLLKLTERIADYFRTREKNKSAYRLYKYALKLRTKTNTATGSDYYWDLKYTLDYAYNFKQRDSLQYYFEQIANVVPITNNTFASNLYDWTGYSVSNDAKAVFDKIEKRCDEYLRAKEQLNEKDNWYAETWMSYGRLLEARGQFERALNCYSEARKTLTPLIDKSAEQYLRLLSLTMDAYNHAKKYDKNASVIATEFETHNEKISFVQPEDYTSNLLTLFSFYKNKGDLNKAELILEKAMTVTEQAKGKKDEDYMNLTLIYSSIVVQTGHTEKLKSLPQYSAEYEQAVIKAMGLSEGSQQIDEFGALMKSGQYLKAITYFEKWSKILLNYFIEKKDFETLALTQLSLGYCYRETGNLRKAEELYLSSKKIAIDQLGKNHMTTPIVLMSVGEFYQATGAFKLAETYYFDAIDLLNGMREKSDKAKNDEAYYMICGRLANLYGAWGYYDGAEKFYYNVLNYTRGLYPEESIQVASAKFDIANLYSQMELYAYAESLFLECEPIYKKTYGENNIQYINMLSGMAALYQQRGKYAEAEPRYIKCKDFFLQALGNKSERYIGVIVDLAVMYYHTGEFEKAKANFKVLNELMLYQADNFFPSLSEKEKSLFYASTSRRFNTYNSFAVKHVSSNPKEANEMYDLQLLTKGMLFKAFNKMRESVLNSKDDSLKVIYQKWIDVKNNLSKVYQLSDEEKKTGGLDEKRLEAQANDLEKRISKQSELFANILSARPTWKTIQQQLKPGEAAIEIVRIKDAVPAYTYSYTGKGFLYDTLGEGGYARVYEIVSDRSAAARAGITEGDVILKVNGTSTKGKTFDEILTMLAPSPSKIELKRKGTGSPYSIQIASDSVFQRSFSRKIEYAALILTAKNPDHAELVLLTNGDELESRYIRYYQNAIRTKIDDAYSYKIFWSAISKKIGDTKKVFLSPDGVYNSINVNTLRNPETSKYVIDELEIVLVSNTADVLLPHTVSAAQQAVLVGFPDYYKSIAPVNTSTPKVSSYSTLAADTTQRFMTGSSITELPGTKTEINTIEEILKPMHLNITKLMATDATEEKIKSIHAPKILHIATHGFFLAETDNGGNDDSRSITGVSDKTLAENPLLRSGLLLAGAGKTISGEKQAMAEDGILTAYEAMNLNLQKTELVVMSACETGLGQIRSGEGVYGLQRAFRAAGAQSILMSLWKVDDQATQELMSKFYSSWLKAGEKQHSFRDAQLSLREKFNHPYYWGAFVMVGK